MDINANIVWWWRQFTCRHNWDYFTMRALDGMLCYFKCCMKCEKTVEIGEGEYNAGYAATYVSDSNQSL